MIPLLDFQKRALNGPVMKSDDFDIGFSMKVRDVVNKYNIKFDPEKLVVDDDTADAVFQAAVDLIADVGLFHLDTLRVIEFSKEEIQAIADKQKQNPAKAVLGRGDDEMTISYRKGSDSRAPTLYPGIAGVITEEEFVPLATLFAREKRVKGFGISGGIAKVGDITPRAGTLSEIHCALWEQEKLEEVLNSVGRPGMNMGLLCTASTVAGTMQCIESSFRDSHNTLIGVHIHPELKIDWDRLLLTNYCHSKNIVPWQSATTLLGLLCRGPEDGAVALVASLLAHMSFANGPIGSVFPTGIDGSWGTRETIWAAAAALRANERNIRLAVGSGTVGDTQWAGTRVGLLQATAMALVYTASGFSFTWLSASPIEALFIDDVMNMATQMEPDEINTLTNAIMAQVDELKETEIPRSSLIGIQDIYDISTLEPLPEYLRAFNQAKEDLINLGVPISNL